MTSRSGYSALALVLLSVCLLAPHSAAGADDVEAKIRKAFTELADSDATVRDAARAALINTERRQLPVLQRIVEQSRPLLPSQAAVLRQIVTQVYLAGEPYDADAGFGFLGVRMLPVSVSQPIPPPDDPAVEAPEPTDLPQTGVVIVERLPGFVGAKALLDGDVVLAIVENPQIQFGSGREFSDAVRKSPPGETIHFHVLRRGRLVKVPVILDPRPSAADNLDNTAMEALDRQRREKANEYWQRTFGPLVSEGVG